MVFPRPGLAVHHDTGTQAVYETSPFLPGRNAILTLLNLKLPQSFDELLDNLGVFCGDIHVLSRVIVVIVKLHLCGLPRLIGPVYETTTLMHAFLTDSTSS